MKISKRQSKVLDIIEKRRSVRAFSPKPLENEDISLLLEAARLAPSSCNTQPFRFIVVQDRDLLLKVARAQPPGTPINKFLKDAAAIVVCVDEPKVLQHKAAGIVDRNNQRIDVGIAMEHMVLVATELGIGSCWIGWFSENRIKDLLRIPKSKTVSVMLALGYPKKETNTEGIGGIKKRNRKKLCEIASVDYYDNYYK